MLLRAAIAAATVATLADVTPAFAQFYGDQGFGRQRFWEQRPRGPQQWRDDYSDDWGYGDHRHSSITRSGGARPMITPMAPPKVPFHSNFAANSIVIDSGGRRLYFVLSPSGHTSIPSPSAARASPGRARKRSAASRPGPIGTRRKMRPRPALPDKMTGGLRNPLGAWPFTRQHALPHSRHQRCQDHRPCSLVGLLPHDERACAALGLAAPVGTR